MDTFCPSDEVVARLLPERIYGRDNHATTNGFDNTIAVDDDGYMINHARGYVGDGIGLRRNVEKQVGGD